MRLCAYRPFKLRYLSGVGLWPGHVGTRSYIPFRFLASAENATRNVAATVGNPNTVRWC